jgi:hypothetical protein
VQAVRSFAAPASSLAAWPQYTGHRALSLAASLALAVPDNAGPRPSTPGGVSILLDLDQSPLLPFVANGIAIAIALSARNDMYEPPRACAHASYTSPACPPATPRQRVQPAIIARSRANSLRSTRLFRSH